MSRPFVGLHVRRGLVMGDYGPKAIGGNSC